MSTTQPTLRLRRDVVQALREVRDLESDKALAEAMGVNQSSVSRVLRGLSQPGPRFIAGLCTALEQPMNMLFVVDEGRAA